MTDQSDSDRIMRMALLATIQDPDPQKASVDLVTRIIREQKDLIIAEYLSQQKPSAIPLGYMPPASGRSSAEVATQMLADLRAAYDGDASQDARWAVAIGNTLFNIHRIPCDAARPTERALLQEACTRTANAMAMLVIQLTGGKMPPAAH